MDAKTYLSNYMEYDVMARRCITEREAEVPIIKDLSKSRKMLERHLGKEEYKRQMTSIIQFADNLQVRADELIKKRDEIRSFMDKIPGIEGEVIRARHIDGLIWNEIADKLFYSYTGVFRAYNRGLQMVQDMLDAADQEG